MSVQLEFKNVSYSSESKTILYNISVSVATGEYITVTGPSGGGKSSFLRMCCHLVSPSSGTVLYDGVDILGYDPVEIRKQIGYCFQQPVLFEDTIEDNLAYPYRIRNQKPDRNRMEMLLTRFNMEKTSLTLPVKNLSGGEKQRVSLARTLLFPPRILLLDEVTSALDVENTAIVENTVLELNKEGITIIWVTHNPAQSKKDADRLMTIADGRLQSMEVLK